MSEDTENGESLKRQALLFRDLVGDELFGFSVAQNIAALERDRCRFEQLAQAILAFFECERCCKCCSEMPIHLSDADLERLGKLDGAALFGKLDEKEVDNYLKTPCPYLSAGVCSCAIYESRPTSCRMFPFVVLRPVPTLQLCPLGKKVFEEFKRLSRKYGKKEVKEKWEEGSEKSERRGSGGEKAVYVALPLRVLEKFLKYLQAEKMLNVKVRN
ncbi:MAG: hypothetical protein C4B55_03905 [Candidatus Methanophagaceae archaeon]|nr:MAG: hypothetical protein C4B55_03905 [Methanophagales archaeon]